MANYIARVELHAAGYEDYENLHSAMERRGFSRSIASDQGIKYKLPTGTYVATNTNVSIDVALQAAVDAAAETRKSSSTIVTDWTNAKWQGLQQV